MRVSTQMKTIPDQDMWYSENKTGVKTQGQGDLGRIRHKILHGFGKKRSLQRGNIRTDSWITRRWLNEWWGSNMSPADFTLFSPNPAGESMAARRGPWSGPTGRGPLRRIRSCRAHWTSQRAQAGLEVAFLSSVCKNRLLYLTSLTF